jgi:UPF0755 protein
MTKVFYKILATVLLLIALVVVWVASDYRAFLKRPLTLPEEGLLLTVDQGSSMRRVAARLVEAGAMEHPYYLRMLARLENQASRIKAGEYRIAAGTTPERLLEQLVSGQVVQYHLTVVEGWNFAQMMEAVAADPVLQHTLEGMEAKEIMARVSGDSQHPEGRFYPDTYYFPRGTTDLQFLRRAYDTMQQVLAREWEGRSGNLPFDTPYEALILASIVERETAVADERPQVAGVLVRRLRKGMRLQVDPTVIYGLGDAFDGNLTRKHLKTDNPYNTYTRKGLPPTPIALPSGAAIHAVLHPADGDALYYVSRNDGTHQFSATLKEHNAAVLAYQKRRGRKK